MGLAESPMLAGTREDEEERKREEKQKRKKYFSPKRERIETGTVSPSAWSTLVQPSEDGDAPLVAEPGFRPEFGGLTPEMVVQSLPRDDDDDEDEVLTPQQQVVFSDEPEELADGEAGFFAEAAQAKSKHTRNLLGNRLAKSGVTVPAPLHIVRTDSPDADEPGSAGSLGERAADLAAALSAALARRKQTMREGDEHDDDDDDDDEWN
jgi:hypothetical protein